MSGIKAYKILWWSIPIIVLSILIGMKDNCELQLHDSYFVFVSWHLALAFALLLGILAAVYWYLRSYKLINALSGIHSLGTSISFLGIVVTAILKGVKNLSDFEFIRDTDSIIAFLILAIIALQLIFILNVIIGLVRGKKLEDLPL